MGSTREKPNDMTLFGAVMFILVSMFVMGLMAFVILFATGQF